MNSPSIEQERWSRTKMALSKNFYARQFEFDVVTASDADKGNVQAYIAEVFNSRYNAKISHFLPSFLKMSSAGSLIGAVGIQAAGSDKLFLEQYLPRRSEQIVSEFFAKPVDRHRIVEIGNLVATKRGSSYLLFIILAATLHTAGFRWMLFTATEQVKQIILKMKYSPITLCNADPSKLSDASAKWGTYYQSNPHVMAGDLNMANEILNAHPLFVSLLEPYRHLVRSWANDLVGV